MSYLHAVMGHPFSGKSLIKILHSWIGKRRQETDFDKDKRKKTQKRWSRPEKVLVAIKIVWSPFHFPHLCKGENFFRIKLFLVEKNEKYFLITTSRCFPEAASEMNQGVDDLVKTFAKQKNSRIALHPSLKPPSPGWNVESPHFSSAS